MRRFYSVLSPAFLLLLTICSFAQSASSPPGDNFDTVDRTLDPCMDFSQYTCANWLKTAEIPPDQTSWSGFVELRERNTAILREIL